ncbi:Hypothetical predicted protein [Scomber scombrus]|uniref:Uncharacterized protein n=1 Tax=Scomber scombrus TaxID=13677 RepID=A0AAV1NGR2_SCOSC
MPKMPTSCVSQICYKMLTSCPSSTVLVRYIPGAALHLWGDKADRNDSEDTALETGTKRSGSEKKERNANSGDKEEIQC